MEWYQQNCHPLVKYLLPEPWLFGHALQGSLQLLTVLYHHQHLDLNISTQLLHGHRPVLDPPPNNWCSCILLLTQSILRSLGAISSLRRDRNASTDSVLHGSLPCVEDSLSADSGSNEWISLCLSSSANFVVKTSGSLSLDRIVDCNCFHWRLPLLCHSVRFAGCLKIMSHQVSQICAEIMMPLMHCRDCWLAESCRQRAPPEACFLLNGFCGLVDLTGVNTFSIPRKKNCVFLCLTTDLGTNFLHKDSQPAVQGLGVIKTAHYPEITSLADSREWSLGTRIRDGRLSREAYLKGVSWGRCFSTSTLMTCFTILKW